MAQYDTKMYIRMGLRGNESRPVVETRIEQIHNMIPQYMTNDNKSLCSYFEDKQALINNFEYVLKHQRMKFDKYFYQKTGKKIGKINKNWEVCNYFIKFY